MMRTGTRLALFGAALLMTVATFAAVRDDAGAVGETPDKVVLNLGLGNSGSPSYWRWTPGNQNIRLSHARSRSRSLAAVAVPIRTSGRPPRSC